MSKIKSPREKKALSLERDRRNTYGENPAASRKGIRRGKQRSHMEERRTVGKILSQLKDLAEEEAATEADVLAKTAIVKSNRKAFKKTPDSPLGEVIKQKLARRAKVLQTKAANSGRAYAIDPKELFDTPYDPALQSGALCSNCDCALAHHGGVRTRRNLRESVPMTVGWQRSGETQFSAMPLS